MGSQGTQSRSLHSFRIRQNVCERLFLSLMRLVVQDSVTRYGQHADSAVSAARVQQERPGMQTRFLVLSFALLLAAALHARDKTDVLVMKNGDRMTCEVKGLDAGVLYVSFDYIDGTASVDWSKVARLESNQLFVVKTEAGKVYAG